MSGAKRPPAAPSSADEAREAARELHAAIKDARAVMRELRAVQAEGREMIGIGVYEINQAFVELHGHVDSTAEAIAASLEQVARRVEKRHTELLGYASANELLAYLCEQMVKAMVGPVSQVVIECMPTMVDEYMDSVVKKPRKGGARVIAINGADILNRLGVEPAPGGIKPAFRAVPSQPSH